MCVSTLPYYLCFSPELAPKAAAGSGARRRAPTAPRLRSPFFWYVSRLRRKGRARGALPLCSPCPHALRTVAAARPRGAARTGCRCAAQPSSRPRLNTFTALGGSLQHPPAAGSPQRTHTPRIKGCQGSRADGEAPHLARSCPHVSGVVFINK